MNVILENVIDNAKVLNLMRLAIHLNSLVVKKVFTVPSEIQNADVKDVLRNLVMIMFVKDQDVISMSFAKVEHNVSQYKTLTRDVERLGMSWKVEIVDLIMNVLDFCVVLLEDLVLLKVLLGWDKAHVLVHLEIAL
jgi:hypothetical protein